jgi:UDP-N-acetylmuramyl pentapeptide phosphotransferase/UDP-N-acetylglucosamine-1-phosphate transferase
VDEPSEARKVHSRSVPTIGGIMLFAGTIIAYSLWFPSGGDKELGINYDSYSALEEFKYLVASMFILFFMGVKDDIIGVSPTKKLLIHLVVAAILVLVADIRITSLHGIFKIDAIPYSYSVILSVFTYIVIVNAMNLIDGVDGLAAGIGLIASTTFSIWFYRTGDIPLALLAAGLSGSLLGFLFFNFNPAKIFMGDSGSLIIGVTLFVLAINMIEHDLSTVPAQMRGVSKPVLAMAILSYPLVDTLRVFLHRTLRGKSPFSADKNHTHHRLMLFGFNHKQVVFTLYTYNLIIIGLTFVVPMNSPNLSFIIVGSIAFGLIQLLFMIPTKKHRKKQESK